ncbi:MAG: hypothetical protein ACOC90_02800, partial [Bacteroidota bacterium]
MIKPVETFHFSQGRHLNRNPEESFLRLSGYPETFRNHSRTFPVIRKPSGIIPGTFRLSGNLQEPFLVLSGYPETFRNRSWY